METCETCKWWDQSGYDDGLYGTCRRNPPREGWPETNVHDWCGEHQPKAVKPEPSTKPVYYREEGFANVYVARRLTTEPPQMPARPELYGIHIAEEAPADQETK